MTRIYTRIFRVRGYECDALGHVNNAVYQHYLEQAATEASAEAGYDLNWYAERGVAAYLPAVQAMTRRLFPHGPLEIRVEDDPEVPDILRVDPESEREQVSRLKAFRSDRDASAVERRLEEVRSAARGNDNLLPVLRQALNDRCTMGEVCGAMRDVFGEYQPTF